MSISRWEGCSPRIGLTTRGLRCKSNHPCAKYNRTDYYWCYVEPNKFNWDWDYCSPPFDSNEPLEYQDFSGNFGLSDLTDKENSCLVDEDKINGSLKRHRRNDERWVPQGSLGEAMQIGHPPLYRILADRITNDDRQTDNDFVEYITNNIGMDFPSLGSRALLSGQARPQFPTRPTVRQRVAQNPDITPWISTSLYSVSSECIIRRNFRRDSRRDTIYLAVIDANRLGEEYPILNLADTPTRNSILGPGIANNYASSWDEVLVYWRIPGRAIQCVRRYTLASDRRAGVLDLNIDVIPNPGYCPCDSQTSLSLEDFSEEDDNDRSNYPNYYPDDHMGNSKFL